MSTHTQSVIAMLAYVAMMVIIVTAVFGRFNRPPRNQKKNTNKRPKGIRRP